MHQGLAENLAAFDASESNSRRSAPQVYEDGQRVSLKAACLKCLTPELREKHRILRLSRGQSATGSSHLGAEESAQPLTARLDPTDLSAGSADSGNQTTGGSTAEIRFVQGGQNFADALFRCADFAEPHQSSDGRVLFEL